jgi:hypothetical protein
VPSKLNALKDFVREEYKQLYLDKVVANLNDILLKISSWSYFTEWANKRKDGGIVGASIFNLMDVPPTWVYRYFKPKAFDLSKLTQMPMPKTQRPAFHDERALDEQHPRAKGAAGRKTNLMLSDVIRIAKAIGYDWQEFLKYHEGSDWTNAAMAGCLLSMLGNIETRNEFEFLWVKYPMFRMPHQEAVVFLNDIHNHIRNTHCDLSGNWLSTRKYTKLQYLGELMNRHEGYPIDPVAEINMRMQLGQMQTPPQIINGQLNYDRLYGARLMHRKIDELLRATLGVFAHGEYLTTRYIHIPTFSEFWAQRLKWISGGSAAGYKLELRSFKEMYVVRAGKRLALELLTTEEMEEVWSLVDPILHSRAAIKYECRKNRALWNTALTHYVICSYLLHSAEQLLNDNSWAIGYQNAAMSLSGKLQRVKDCQENKNTWMWDYADFNIAHGLHTQATLFILTARRLKELNVNKAAESDIEHAAQWCAKAVLNTWMEAPTEGVLCRVNRSLMTGARGTAYTNTILNGVYRLWIDDITKNIFNDEFIESYCGMGDDVWCTLRRWYQGPILGKVFNLCGLTGQELKLIDNPGTGELLRVHYDKNGTRGFLNRSIASAVCGEFHEKIDYNDPESIVICTNSFIRKLENRGLDGKVSCLLRDRLVRNKATLFYTRKGSKRKIKPMAGLALAHTWNNGLGVGYQNLGADHTTTIWPRRQVVKFRVHNKYLRQLRGCASADAINPLRGMIADESGLTHVRNGIVESGVIGKLPSPLVTEILASMANELDNANKHLKPITITELARPHLRVHLPIIRQIWDSALESGKVPNNLWGIMNKIIYESRIPTRDAFDYVAKGFGDDEVRNCLLCLLEMRNNGLIRDTQDYRNLLHFLNKKNVNKIILKRYVYGDIPFDDVANACNESILALVRQCVITYIERQELMSSMRDINALQRVVAHLEWHFFDVYGSEYEHLKE